MISRKEAEAEETIRRLRLSHNVRQTIADIRYSVSEDQGNKNFQAPDINDIFLAFYMRRNLIFIPTKTFPLCYIFIVVANIIA